MDIEQLSKSQIILLTLLVSFVTSIATGIVTVSLVDQAPPAVAETVNRVIERTVEKAVPSQAAATVVTQQKTVVVKESDMIAQAVTTANPSIVRIYSTAAAASSTKPTFLALGVVVNAAGEVATDASAIGKSTDASIALSDGTTVPASVSARNDATGIAYLTPATSTDQKKIDWTPAQFASPLPVLGESAITFAGEAVTRIGDGIVTSVNKGDAKTPTVIDTNIPNTAIMNGSPLIGNDGSILGVSTGISRASSQTGFVSAATLSAGGTPAAGPAPQSASSTSAGS